MCSRKHAALDRARVADQIEVGVRLPSLARETLAALFGGHRRIRAGIGVGKHRVGVLVERGLRIARAGRRGRSRRRLTVRSAATASGHQQSDDEPRATEQHAHRGLLQKTD